jgi:hypothetical protein
MKSMLIIWCLFFSCLNFGIISNSSPKLQYNLKSQAIQEVYHDIKRLSEYFESSFYERFKKSLSIEILHELVKQKVIEIESRIKKEEKNKKRIKFFENIKGSFLKDFFTIRY